MTEENTNGAELATLLRGILDRLDRLENIDRNVEEILDRVGDHLDDVKYNTSWNDRHYGEYGE